MLARYGAEGGNRTHTNFRSADFKSAASASFATSAQRGITGGEVLFEVQVEEMSGGDERIRTAE